MPSKPSALPAAQLAALFTQLQQLEAAGLPAFQACALLAESSPDLKNPLALMQRQLKAGKPISEAGFRAGIFDGAQQALLRAAETSGQLAAVYEQLAAHYSALSGRINSVRSRLLLPVLVLAIALLVQPLPALVGAQIGVGGYLLLVLGRLAMIAAALFLLVRLPGILRGLGAGASLLNLPVAGRWRVRRQLNEFFFMLALLLESGLAFSEALPGAVATISDAAVRDSFAPALAMLGSGASVAASLAEVKLIDAEMLGVVDSSEQSGRLASGMMQYTQLEAEAIGRQDDALAAWLPRIIYALVAAWMAYSLLAGASGVTPG